MSPRWVDQTFVQRFPSPHKDTPCAHNGMLKDELGRQKRESLFGAHAWAARWQKASLETALASVKEGGSLFIIQSEKKKGRGELLHRKAGQNTLWGRNEGWIIQGAPRHSLEGPFTERKWPFSPTKCFLLGSAKEADCHSGGQLSPLKSTHVSPQGCVLAPKSVHKRRLRAKKSDSNTHHRFQDASF